MATFERAPKSVEHMAKSLLQEFGSHADLHNCGAVIDFVFARAEVDDDGNVKGYALTKNGIRALGVARKLPLKDRAMGWGDAEISIDADWWDGANEAQQRALLDHELHHLYPKMDKRGVVVDDLGHPVIKLRQHDHGFGWFNIIAERHKAASIEVRQAKSIMDNAGQWFWPDLVKALKA
jgi:hypothetical protein